MAIGQSFGPQFGYQTMIPKKEKKEELQSRMFPGLDDGQSKRLVETVDKLGITDTSEKLKKQQEIYKEVLPQIKAKEAQMNRQVIKNEQYNATLDTKDPKQKAVKMAGLKMEDLADMIKEKYDLDPNAPTDGIISEYNTMLNDMGIDEKLVEDYMNGKSDELLYVSGLKEDTRGGAENKSVLGVAENVVGGAYDSATGLPRFVAQNLAKGVGWIAKKLGADEEKVQGLVDSYIESLKDFSGEAIGADTDNMLYKGTKMVGDIAQIANPAGLGKAGIKAGQVAAKIGKEGSLIGKVAKGATIGAVDTAVFMPQSEQRMATGKELAIGAAAGGVLPIAGVGLNVAKKGFAKIAPKLELSGLLNPSKLNTVKEKLIQEGVDKADALDVGKWMLDRGIKGNKEQIVSQLDNLANQSKKAVDDTLLKSTTLFKNKTADDLLDKLAQEYDGSISQSGRDKFSKIQGLIQKSKKEGLTLTELNDVKRMVWDLDTYTATGKVKVSKSDLAGANSELKKFIEKSATETIEGVDENMIKMLNNETQIARGLSEGIAKKESADAVREIVNFMAGRSPGAIVGGTVGYQQGGDWKSTIIGALAGGALGSTSMKTKAANMLYKAFNKQEQTVLQKFIQGGGAEKLSPKIIKKLDKVMSDIKTLVLVGGKTQSPQKGNIIRVAPTKTPPKLPTKNESISRPVVRMKAPEEPLMAEARKYKSAEEFIKKNTKFIHETESPKFEKFDMSKIGEGQGESRLGRGIYLQEKGGFKLENYGGNKINAGLSPDAKIFEVKNKGGEYRDNLVKYVVDNGLDGGIVKERMEEGLSMNNILPRDLFRRNGNKIIEKLKKDGYDGLLQDGELVIYNDNVIKTESQLKQIREEANSKGLKPKK